MTADTPGVRNGRRVAIVDGLRTPFMKAGTAFKDLSALDLAAASVNELVERSPLSPDSIDQVVFGAVIPDIAGPNIGREVASRVNLPHSVDAYSVSRACATSTQSVVSGTQAILTGDADVVIAGGVESMSRPPVVYSDAVIDALMSFNAAKDVAAKARALATVRPKDLAPRPPALEDQSSGLTMGQAAEKMARENGITREAQDAYAFESHLKAVEAWEKGVFDDEVMALPIPPAYEDTAHMDGIPRADTSLDKLAALKPAFDRKYGTVTAGNASPLTDGAAAVILMEESVAQSHGIEPRAFVRSWAFTGLDASWQMLMGPAFATPIALERAGMTLADIDVIDMHEAFASQMLSNIQAFGSTDWATEHLDRETAIGEIDPEKLNLYGGSISLGHPFGATGARQAMTMANELMRRDDGTALITQCAAGGLGAALILER